MNKIFSDISAVVETQTAVLARLVKKKTITEKDVTALRQADLVIGVVSRREAEQMFAIEHGPARKCRGWGDLLVETLLDFVVWGERPTGRLSNADAAWLLDQAGETPSPACLALLIAAMEEAGSVPDWYPVAVRARAKRLFSSGVPDELVQAAA